MTNCHITTIYTINRRGSKGSANNSQTQIPQYKHIRSKFQQSVNPENRLEITFGTRILRTPKIFNASQVSPSLTSSDRILIKLSDISSSVGSIITKAKSAIRFDMHIPDPHPSASSLESVIVLQLFVYLKYTFALF